MPAYYGQFTLDHHGFILEGRADCLIVSKLETPDSYTPLCEITGKDRKGSHELVMLTDERWPDTYRTRMINTAVDCYRMWQLRDPLRPA